MLLGTLAAAPLSAAYPGPTARGSYTVISTPGLNVTQVKVVPGPNGMAIAVWVEHDGTNWTVMSADQSSDGSWGTPVALGSANVSILTLSLQQGPGGQVAVLWVAGSDPASVVVRERSGTGPWAVAHAFDVNEPGRFILSTPRLAVGADGRLAAVWSDTNGSFPVVHAGIVDANGTAGVFNLTDGIGEDRAVWVATAGSDGFLAGWCRYDDSAIIPTTWLITDAYTAAGGWEGEGYPANLFTTRCNVADALASAGGNTTVVFDLIYMSSTGVGSVVVLPTGLTTQEAFIGYVDPAIAMRDLELDPVPGGGMVAYWDGYYYDVFGSGGFIGEAGAVLAAPNGTWGPYGTLVGGAPSPVRLGVSAPSASSMAAVALLPGDDIPSPIVFQYTDREGCGGWSRGERAVDDGFATLDAAVFLRANGTGILLDSHYNAAGTAELRSQPLQLPAQPAVTWTAPSNGSTTDRATGFVNGTGEPYDTVVANGYAGQADANGSFSVRVPLVEGPNAIDVTVTRTQEWAPCSVSRSFVVTYVDPVPALRANLSGLMANLSTAQAQVAALEASGNASQAALQAAEAAVANATAEVARLQGQLAALGANDTATQADLADAQAQIAAANAQIRDLSARLNSTSSQGAAQPASDMAMVLALLGVGLGAAGLAVAVMTMMRKGPKPPT